MNAPHGVRLDGDCISLTSRVSIGEACAGAVRMQGGHLLPLLEAARRADLALGVIASPDASFPVAQVARWSRPAVILIGDDPCPDGDALGPLGWACARRLRYWQPRFVIVHGTGPHPDHYRTAVEVAPAFGRVAVIERSSARVDEWVGFFGCPNTVRFVPPDGCVHPDRAMGARPC